jgi:hypothetical protein
MLVTVTTEYTVRKTYEIEVDVESLDELANSPIVDQLDEMVYDSRISKEIFYWESPEVITTIADEEGEEL